MGWFQEFTAGFAKYILFVFNLIILLAAILLIVFAAKNKSNNAGLDVMSVSTLAIILGILIGAIAFFGCCGAVKENPCMLSTYAGILITLFVLQLILGIMAFVAVKNGDHQLKDEVNKHLLDLYKHYNTSSDAKSTIDSFQEVFSCCGLEGKDQYIVNGTGFVNSCCKVEVRPCTKINRYNQFCDLKLTEFVQGSIHTIGWIAIIFAAIELVASIFACYIRDTR